MRLYIAIFACLVVGLGNTRLSAQPEANAPPKGARTKEQQEKLKECEKLKGDIKKLRAAGKLPEAIAIAKRIVAIQQQAIGETQDDLADSLVLLAKLQEEREDFQAARKDRQRVLQIRTKLHGKEHWKVTDAQLGLADLSLLEGMRPVDRGQLREADRLSEQVQALSGAGKYREALTCAQKAADIRRRLLGETHPVYVASLNDEACLYGNMGDFTKAEPLWQKASKIWRETLGEGHPSYARSLNDLGWLYHSTGAYGKAEPLYRKAMEIKRAALGEMHADYGLSLNNLGMLYKSMGDNAKAKPLLQKAVEIRKETLGEKHSDYAESLSNLALVYDSMGAYRQAEPLYQKALEIRKAALGEKHPYYANSLHNLAGLYQHMGAYAQAEPLYQRALEIRKAALGAKHPRYANSLRDLGNLYSSRGEYAKAKLLLEKASETNTGDAMIQGHLGRLYLFTEDYAKAEPLLQKASQIFRQSMGENNSYYAATLNDLASLYQSLGAYAKAEPLYQKALQIHKQSLGEKHSTYASTLNNLAGLYQSMGGYAKAEPLNRKALDICRRTLGEDHPGTVSSYTNEAINLIAQKNYREAGVLLEAGSKSYEATRLAVAATGLERAAYGVARSPYALFAACKGRTQDYAGAWAALEADLARGLLDEIVTRRGIGLTADEQRQRIDLNAGRVPLNKRVLVLVSKSNRTAAENDALNRLIEDRHKLEESLDALAVEVSRREVATLAELQAALSDDAAFVAWVDVSDRFGGVQEHWGCVVRTRGDPFWERLPGSGPNSTWTKQDTELPGQFRPALAQSALASEFEALTRRMWSQRLAPLEKHLTGIKRLFVAPVYAMAGIPIEVLNDKYMISYTPSGTYLARHKKSEPPATTRLLAIGDPVFPRDKEVPGPSTLPPGGLLITQVAPDGNAGRAHLRSGDVLVSYAGESLSSVDQLTKLVAAQAKSKSVGVKVWREGKDSLDERNLEPGKLGVGLAKRARP
jgi:tetratricopeptide (TPR) repeat protein